MGILSCWKCFCGSPPLPCSSLTFFLSILKIVSYVCFLCEMNLTVGILSFGSSLKVIWHFLKPDCLKPRLVYYLEVPPNPPPQINNTVTTVLWQC